MGLREKIFGSNPAKKSLRQLSQEGDIPLSVKDCDLCGDSFLLPALAIGVNVPMDNSKLNLGGYCQKCERHLCPKHAEFLRFTSNSGEFMWIAACSQCRVPLQEGPKS